MQAWQEVPGLRFNVGAKMITNTIAGVSYYDYRIKWAPNPILIIKALILWFRGAKHKPFQSSAEPGTSPGTTGRRWKWARLLAAGLRTGLIARPVGRTDGRRISGFPVLGFS